MHRPKVEVFDPIKVKAKGKVVPRDRHAGEIRTYASQVLVLVHTFLKVQSITSLVLHSKFMMNKVESVTKCKLSLEAKPVKQEFV